MLIRPKYKICISILLGTLLLAGCSSTKFVPEGKNMLNKVEVEVDNEEISKEELKSNIRQKSNLRILGMFKFYLAVYNLSSNKRENDWLKRIGEAPVIYEEYKTQRTIDQMQVYLRNKGYYNAQISDTLIQHRKKSKVNQVYKVQTNKSYIIRRFDYDIKDENISILVMNDSVNHLIKSGRILDVDVLAAEQKRITKYLNNEGYYNFSEDFIGFVADTALYQNQVDLTIQIDPYKEVEDSIVNHKKYKINSYTINSEYVATGMLPEENEKLDTTTIDDYTFIYRGRPNYNPQLFKNLNRINDSTYYSLNNVEKTYRALNRLRQFKVININFTELDSILNEDEGLLDCQFQLSPLPRQGVSVEVEGTNSSGNLGVAGNFNLQHRNVFHGAEVFDFKLRGAMERQQAVVNNSDLEFNTREFGLELGLTIPKFLSPIRSSRLFSFQIPQTKLSVGYNYQRRPDYTRTITNMTFGYNWKSSQNVTQNLNLLDLNYVNLYEFNAEFIESIKDYYIKSSFTDHLIFALNYGWVYNNQNLNKRNDYEFIKLNFESAGNLLSAYSGIINKEKVAATDTTTNSTISYYKAFNTRFAQYLKGDFEYRYGYMLDEYNSLVGRAFIGLGIPYGNFDVLPFEKKYFTGGANGIRAWQVRSLGPGTFKAPAGDYPNQSSDIKLEANLEYRFRLFMMVEGALFMDAGNIWAINNKDNREGVTFKFNEFYKQIAVGTGVGLRFDFKYFLFRLDLGMKLRDPSLEDGKRWIPGNYKIDQDKFNLSFAIGYPF